jgi:hypothetical protein
MSSTALRAERINGDRENRQVAGDPAENTVAAVGSQPMLATTEVSIASATSATPYG